MIGGQPITLKAVPGGDRPVLDGLRRGARGRCPNCGRGRLFRDYLKIQRVCRACAHNNGQYPADDAPPYFTILILGHVVIGPLLIFPFFGPGRSVWCWRS